MFARYGPAFPEGLHSDLGNLALSTRRNINRRSCEAAHTSSGMGKLFVAPLPPRGGERMESAMRSINFWSRSLSRVELDQRSRKARLRFERIERLLVSDAAERQPRLRRLLSLRSVGEHRGRPQKSRVRGPLSDRRPSRMPTILEVGRLEEALS